MANKTLYVGNLPHSLTDNDLLNTFSAYGGTNAHIIPGRGFGFVDVDADKAETAIADKNNSEVEGRRLTVNEARPREPRSSGGGGGSGYGGGRSRGGNRW